jgi:hypothetical protein
MPSHPVEIFEEPEETSLASFAPLVQYEGLFASK